MAIEEVPPAVERAAERQGLGSPVAAHRSRPAGRRTVMTLLLGGSAGVVLGSALLWGGSAWHSTSLGLTGRFFLAAGLIMLFFGARTHLRRPQHYFLYTGGLVHHGSRGTWAVTWSEIVTLTRHRVSGRPLLRVTIPRESIGTEADPVVGYLLARGNGELIYFKLSGNDLADARFSARVEAAAAEAGVPLGG